MEDMCYGVTLSTENYDSLLTGWSRQTVKSNVKFHGGNSKYSTGPAENARQNLIDNYNWTITDGGGAVAIIPIDKPQKDTVKTVAIYPNPVNRNADAVNIVIPSNLSGEWDIKILDAVGNLIDKSSFNANRGTTFHWDLLSNSGNRIAAGTYLLIAKFTDLSGKTEMFKRIIGVKK